jgi:hypothetical protein
MKRHWSGDLQALRRRLDGWRESNDGKRQPIPERFWVEAARVARVDGVWATSRALRINYNRIAACVARSRDHAKRRRRGATIVPLSAGQTSDRTGAAGESRRQFVALEMGTVAGGAKTVIDLLNGRGDRMRVEVPGSVDVVALCSRLWSRPA